ncbi:MAG: exopolysaccharide Pel transporter PelG, partial [Candidatus Riflebacteria bacterium]
RSILTRRNFRSIVNRFEDIGRTINYTTWELLKVQGGIAITIFFFTPELLQAINYSPDFAGVLRWGILGAFFQLLFLVFSLMLLYFEFRKEAMWCNFIFLALNSAVTLINVYFRQVPAYGFGYFLSTMVAAIVSWYFLKVRTKKLIFHTFMSQKMPREINEQPEFIVRSLGTTAFSAGQKKPGQAPSP